jgi:hypothetical protein
VKATLDAPDVFRIAFSPDGKTLAAAGSPNNITLWEVATAKKRFTFPAHRSSIIGLDFSPDGRTLASASSMGKIKLWDALGIDESGAVRPDPGRTWSVLASRDAALAYRTIRGLTAAPRQAVPFLRDRLRPVPFPPEKLLRQIDGWLADLDSGSYVVRRQANERLEKVGEQAEVALRQALVGRPSLELRRRVEALLARIERERASRFCEELRQLRALEVLEHIGTAEARQVLEALAGGYPEARLTQEAKASLRRLARRQTATP